MELSKNCNEFKTPQSLSMQKQQKSNKVSYYFTCCNGQHQDRHNQGKYREANLVQYILCSLNL